MKEQDEIKELIKESLGIIASLSNLNMDESAASEQAAQMGLFSRGFGRYSKSEHGVITHKTSGGKLVPSNIEPLKKKSSDGGPKKYVKKPKSIQPMKKFDAPPEVKKIGVTDIQKIRGDKPVYIFKYNGRAKKIILSKREIEAYESGLITIEKIIINRIRRKELKMKRGLPSNIEKQLKAKKEKD